MIKLFQTLLVLIMGCALLLSCDENSSLMEDFTLTQNQERTSEVQTQKRKPEISYSTLDTIEEYGTRAIYINIQDMVMTHQRPLKLDKKEFFLLLC